MVEKYLDGDLKEELLKMLRHLQSSGMNYNITDSESSDRVLQPSVHWWLSPNVIHILEELDTLGKRAKASRLVLRKGIGLALLGSGFVKWEAKPKAKKSAWLGLALA